MARFRDVLKNRNFFLLWSGQIISNFGDRLNQMALIGFVFQKAPHSTYELAKLMLFIIIPVFLVGPVAGAYVDRWNRRHVMVISDIIRGLLVLLIPFFILKSKSDIPIYFVVFIIFSITRFFISSKMAIIPSLVSKDELLIANSLSDTTYMIATIIGIGVAGIVVKLAGVLGGFYINSLSFFLSAGLISLIRPKNSSGRYGYRQDLKLVSKALGSALRKSKSIWAQVREGIMFIVSYPNARFVMNVWFLLMAGAGAIFCIIIVFIQEKFGTVTSDLGFLGMFLGSGLLCGTLLYGKLGQRFDKQRAILTSIILSGLAIIGFAFLVAQFPTYKVAGVLTILIGMLLSPIIISINTLLHEAIPDDLRGRIFSSQEVVIHLAFLIFMFTASIMAEYIDRMWILVGCGTIFSILGVCGLVTKILRN